MAATSPDIRIFTLALPKIRAFYKGLHCLHPHFTKMKKDIDKQTSPLYILIIGKFMFGKSAKLDEIKIVKNCCKRKMHCRIWRTELSLKFILIEPRIKKSSK